MLLPNCRLLKGNGASKIVLIALRMAKMLYNDSKRHPCGTVNDRKRPSAINDKMEQLSF